MTKYYDSLREMEEWGRELDRMRREEPEKFCCICDRFAEDIYRMIPGSGRFNISICVSCNRTAYLLGLTVDNVVERRFRRGTPFSIDALYRASMHLNTSDTKDIRS